MLRDAGLSLDKIAEMNIGPILFREELVYLREIHLNDEVKVTVVMTRYNTANSRFSFRHEIYRSDGTKCAVVTVDGAWMDIGKRKLTVLPEDWQAIVIHLPKSEDYEEVTA